MVAGGMRTLVARVRDRIGRGGLALEAATMSTRLGWQAPATTVTFAGLHGGAGTSTLCLLTAHAIATFGEAPAVTVDLAGRSRGGLAVLGAAAGQTTAEGTAAITAIDGRGLETPFGVNQAGVRVLGTHPDGIEDLDRSHEALVARVVQAVDRAADDADLAERTRRAVADDRAWQALRWDNGQVAQALGNLLDLAVPHHALVGIDLGLLDSERLSELAAQRSDLHVWVLPARPHSFEVAERRLAKMPFAPGGGEAIAVWADEHQSVSAKRLSALGDRRGCPVVRLADHGGQGHDWSSRVQRCLSGIADLCDLAR